MSTVQTGIWGTAAVGLLATPDAPAGLSGLLYTGSVSQLGIQLLGVAAVALYAALAMIATFFLIGRLHGLRVTEEEELAGLDSTEHGLPSAYPDFAPAVERFGAYAGSTPVVVPAKDAVSPAEAVVVQRVPSFKSESEHADGSKFTKVEIVCREARFDALKNALMELGITGMTVSHVVGCGVQGGKPEYYRGVAVETNLLPKIQVDVVVSKVPVRSVIETAKQVLYTGHIGDGKIFVYDVENVVKVRTGEEGYDALQDVE